MDGRDRGLFAEEVERREKWQKTKAFPQGEYIKFYCYDNIKQENRKFPW
jgi:hypothetical protein